MRNTAALIKYTLVKQVRNNNSLLILLLCIFFGFLCVPSMADKYQIFYLGGVRGIYNSEWLGAMAAIIPIIVLWLPGFYFLRSQVSDDKYDKMDQLIASSTITKLTYISVKFLCNLIILLSAALIFTVSVIFMQLFRGESMMIKLSAYFIPFISVTVPYLTILAALTIFFDVASGLKGVIGNILIFILWVGFSAMSIEVPGKFFDVFGLGTVLEAMLSAAKQIFPSIPDAASFGFYPNDGNIPTFIWNGLNLERDFLISRFLWILISIVIVIISSLLFDRFRTKEKRTLSAKKTKIAIVSNRNFSLSPVKKNDYASFLTILKGEFKILFSDTSIWLILIIMASIVFSFFTKNEDAQKWISLIMLLPMGMWSQMGCREKIHRTEELIYSSSSKLNKWLASLVAVNISAILISSGVLLRFAISGQFENFTAWFIGALFAATLALFCGTLSGGRRMFEGIFITLMYLGPISDMPYFDFLGVQTRNASIYLVLFLALVAAGILIQMASEKYYSIKISKGRA